ncbi:MAG: endoribonuclease [Verrucomicrobiia bacterium]
MVTKGVIPRNLRDIELLYDKAKSSKKKFYFAKLAVLELCGWLESTQDKLVRESADRCISAPQNLSILDERIKKTHGFEYDQHFRQLLILVAGISRLEKIESEFDQSGSLTQLRSLLGKLKDPRNIAAHTHTTGVLPTIDAPSVVRKDLDALYTYLRELERILKKAHY